ncbi:MAG: phage integrase N-terminal SAM-like domain-containing protein [Ardenticatenaceae bacterium]|nr:phage integrase N-terminal SAM-like domain-containing protein [Anaerolineales bacterium]MCB8920125.1 phage integrase N-terminal SAM-like domain-containing protein [Ardenticatenaceae bacterium]MCB8992187.1 phage integrase N-terminal SAM-like domain-containing protein [Ardenticatenaceae bacterium]MCB9005082.1 phage integrase N-terminal SAM-like domain-containing protein [Ardenticatenaceae bacterium]
MSDNKQKDLFPESSAQTMGSQPQTLSRSASIQAALGRFEVHMRDEGFALNTVKAFASDVRLLGKYLGIGQPVGDISTQNLNDFLNWMLNERGVPCSPKSYARRVTTLKVFFKWLHDTGVLPDDPATAVIQHSVKSPLPAVPGEEALEKALAVSMALRQGTEQAKPDARPRLLLTLLLQTAIKKSEAMNIVPNHIDRSDPTQPMIFIRYANPRLRYKERRLPLDPDWLPVLDEYLEQYAPPDTLFTCTPRNLEYILSDIGSEAGLEQGDLSFENLRWASALRDFRNNVEQDDIRQKLGLSKITWRETKAKLEKLLAKERGEPV